MLSLVYFFNLFFLYLITPGSAVLIKSGKFGLPSRRKLWKDTAEIEVIAINVASTEIERPKKIKNITVGSNAVTP